MHIALRSSGGRGEYEVVGDAGGYSAGELEGWTFHVRWPDGITRDTNLWLDPAGSGKPRLRSLVKPEYQIGRLIAAMLLLPDPRRKLSDTDGGLPVARSKQFAVTRVGFRPDSEFAPVPEQVTFAPNYVEIANRAYQEKLGVDSRWARIAAIFARADALPDAVRAPLEAHRDLLAAGDPLTPALSSRVVAIAKGLATVGPSYILDDDPLPYLERLLGVTPAEGPDLPPPDEIGEDDVDVRVESASDYRLARMRGPSARAFAAAVRRAYKNRCAFCGAVYGGIEGIVSGIDAAHILAWSKWDLDVVSNGIALCKLHHWAFDAGLMLPVVDKAGNYGVMFTELAAKLDALDRAKLGESGMAIPDDWLPADKADRPNPKYLKRLYDDLLVPVS